MSLRAIRTKARTDLHNAMRVRAYYFATIASEPLPVWVRVHTDFKALGDLKGTNFSYAETQEAVPALIFWRSEIEPANGSLVTTLDEGFRVDHSMPPDGLTITAKVSRLDADEFAALPHPEE